LIQAQTGTRYFHWLIVGGGIHGVHLAVRLLDEGVCSPERLVIVDPGPCLLDRWRACTAVTGMAYLRSPSVHHLATHPYSLLRFAGKRKDRAPGLFAPPYDRPLLELFQRHCDHVIEEHELDRRHLRDRVVACKVRERDVEAGLESGERIIARRVVLAIGASEAPDWPSWAPRGHPRVHHVFSRDFDGWPPAGRRSVGVVGGGISAAQVAVRLVRAGHRVELVSRHAVREHQFDSEPGWLGPKFMGGFAQTRDPVERRAILTEARHRGSLPPDVRRDLRRAQERGGVRWHESEVEALEEGRAGLQLRLASGERVEIGHLLLATGFSMRRPGGRMIDELVESASLPCAPCGYPICDSALRWHPRIHVSGPLAELELGPVSRNIAGAQRAGERIVEAALEGTLELRGVS